MSSPPSTSPSSLASDAGAVRQVHGLPFTHSGPPPSSPITPPSDYQPPLSSSDDALSPSSYDEDTDPRHQGHQGPPHPTPEREPLDYQPTHRPPKEQSAICDAVRAFPARFLYQEKHGPTTNSDHPIQCVDFVQFFVCMRIQWRNGARAAVILYPPNLFSVCLILSSAAGAGSEMASPQLAKTKIRTQDKDFLLAGGRFTSYYAQ